MTHQEAGKWEFTHPDSSEAVAAADAVVFKGGCEKMIYIFPQPPALYFFLYRPPSCRPVFITDPSLTARTEILHFALNNLSGRKVPVLCFFPYCFLPADRYL
jgi:hypothetical protein